MRAAEATAIDPRIRARRIEVQRDAGRRRLRRVVDLGLVLLVLVGFLAALRSPLLDVERVRVAGGQRTPAEAVLAEAGVAAGQQLVDLDLGEVGERVAALPWVDEVTVRRRLGGTVDIRITERVASAIVGAGPAAVLVDDEGRALAHADAAPDVAEGLVRVLGLPGEVAPGGFLPPESREALALAGELAAAVPGAIGEVVLGEELRATLVQGGEVRFGDTARLPAKLRSLATVLAQVDLACLGELDLRAPASPVLTRREGCS